MLRAADAVPDTPGHTPREPDAQPEMSEPDAKREMSAAHLDVVGPVSRTDENGPDATRRAAHDDDDGRTCEP